MPESIRLLAELSPLYWSLNAFHKIFIGGGSLFDILPYAGKLLLFFGITSGIAYLFNRSKNR
jgi:hypothetical protein